MNLRDSINDAIKTGAIVEIRFVRIHQWQWVLETFAERFLINRKKDLDRSWLWESIVEPYISSQPDNAIDQVRSALQDGSSYWFVASEEDGKYWVLQGSRKGIVTLLSEMHCFEYYILTNNFDSMMCEDHHGVLYIKGPSFS